MLNHLVWFCWYCKLAIQNTTYFTTTQEPEKHSLIINIYYMIWELAMKSSTTNKIGPAWIHRIIILFCTEARLFLFLPNHSLFACSYNNKVRCKIISIGYFSFQKFWAVQVKPNLWWKRTRFVNNSNNS